MQQTWPYQHSGSNAAIRQHRPALEIFAMSDDTILAQSSYSKGAVFLGRWDGLRAA
jgi:hypothetical protein